MVILEGDAKKLTKKINGVPESIDIENQNILKNDLSVQSALTDDRLVLATRIMVELMDDMETVEDAR